MFQSNLFPCRFLFKHYLNLLRPGESFTQATKASPSCILVGKCLKAPSLGQMLRYVYFVVYNCSVYPCSLNRTGYV